MSVSIETCRFIALQFYILVYAFQWQLHCLILVCVAIHWNMPFFIALQFYTLACIRNPVAATLPVYWYAWQTWFVATLAEHYSSWHLLLLHSNFYNIVRAYIRIPVAATLPEYWSAWQTCFIRVGTAGVAHQG